MQFLKISVCEVTGSGLIVKFQRLNEKGSLGNLLRKVRVLGFVELKSITVLLPVST